MIYEKKDTTALITINRPKALNAFNSQMLDELTEALEMAEKDTGVRCVILMAAGERAFTAGGDIKEEVQLNETTAADITVAATDAKIGIPTIKLGGIPGWGSTVLLPRTVGASRAKELLYTGRSLSAEEALKLGVVEDVVEPDELLKRAFELADMIADMAPLAVENMKKSINTAMSAGLEESLGTETDIFASCFGTQDHLEATTAFLEKRAHGEFMRK